MVLAHLSSGHVTLFDLFACSISGMILFLNPSEGEARIPKTSYMGDIFSAILWISITQPLGMSRVLMKP